MKTYENRDPDAGQRRSHPWSSSETGAYHDFRAHPDLISSVLEDFRPWDAEAAIRSFYDLLTWINGPASALESNDCAFTGPEANADHGFAKRLQCSGRFGLLFRDLRTNTSDRAIRRLIRAIHVRLTALDPDFAWGAVGTTRLGVDYLELPARDRAGWQVLVSFWAWGDDEPELFENLGRVIAALREALPSVVPSPSSTP